MRSVVASHGPGSNPRAAVDRATVTREAAHCLAVVHDERASLRSAQRVRICARRRLVAGALGGGSGRTENTCPGGDQYDKQIHNSTFIGCSKTLPCWHLCLAPTGITRTRLFSVDCGRNRQSGPRPETRLLRQPALEGLTRSARTDSPRRIGRNEFRRLEAAAAAAAIEERRGGASL
ncbi:hypothetical protein F511_40536 [Dorcoceras hygrometricum]|uniref:Uncharacterized protein n=1 Tax=Dorcoceras hygrometricum TaxID=472368 RepID=A0A2Z7AGG7_9LAMI|nr:hypothetical protein F511_40536 [Dorcoceras hygrometricum]